MKVAYANQKNQNKNSFIDKKTRKDGVRVNVKLACHKEWIKLAVAKYSESFSENDQSAYQETSAVNNDFNHPSEDYVNRIFIDLPAQIMSTQNDCQNSCT